LMGSLINIRCASDHSRGFCLKARENQFGEIQRSSEHLQWCSVCDPAKIFLTSHPRLFSYLLSFNSTHKTKDGMQIGGRLLIATQLDQSSDLANQQ
jgi:hypothetical protein